MINPYSFGSGGDPGSLNLVITAGADDGRDANGGWFGGGTFADAGNISGAIYDAGFRFTGCVIPAGANITLADFKPFIVTVAGGGGVVLVHIYEVNDAGAWNGVGPATVPVTAASVSLTLSSTGLQTISLIAPLQEVVDSQSGINGAVSVVVLDNGSATNSRSGTACDEHLTDPSALFNIAWT